ncbi:MAG: class I SAM-dependent methyltransferase [Candidatus Bathyarchaeota archaeon]|nr:class I SAM-dependent methyltransferase [Candidatus Bathyarchaeota archaeon]
MKDRANQFDKDYFRSVEMKYKRYKDLKEMQRKYFPRSILEEKIKSKSRVLDIGCAFGYFLKLCDDYNLETYGVDVSKYAINEAKRITKAKLYLGDINEGLSVFNNEFFDLVTMFDVIEHLKNPWSLLTEVYRVLRRGGKMIIVTPNINAIAKLLEKNQWGGFSDPSHFYLFTSDSLRFLVEKAGFLVTRLETTFYPLPGFLQKILNRTGKGGEIWLVGKKI